MERVRPRLLKSLVDTQRAIRCFFVSSKLEELKVQDTFYSSGSPALPCIRISLLDHTPRVSKSVGLGQGQESVFLTVSSEMILQLIWESYFEKYQGTETAPASL